jgi:hypothetical protein
MAHFARLTQHPIILPLRLMSCPFGKALVLFKMIDGDLEQKGDQTVPEITTEPTHRQTHYGRAAGTTESMLGAKLTSNDRSKIIPSKRFGCSK